MTVFTTLANVNITTSVYLFLIQKSSCTTSSEPNVRGTQAFTKITDSLSENQEHRNGNQVSKVSRASHGWRFVLDALTPCLPPRGQCPAVRGRAVLAVFLPHHRAARAPAGAGPLQGVPAAVLGLRNSAELGLCPGKLISVFIAHICTQELASLLLLFGSEKDNNEPSLLNLEVWSCELGGRLPPRNGTGFTGPCIYLVRGTCLFIEDSCVILMISWPRAMPDLTRG